MHIPITSLVVMAVAVAGPVRAAEPSGPATPEPPAHVRAAIDDAAQRTGIPVANLKVASVELVTWLDGSLGCPEADMMYTQALVPGYRIRIEAGGKALDYHAGTRGQTLFCPPGRARPPAREATSAPAAEGGAIDHAHMHHAIPAPGTGQYQRSLHAYAVPEVVLVNAEAQPVRLRELLGDDQPVMLNFIFTTCTTICPVMSKVFADLPAHMGTGAANLRLVSISIDPENDTPAQLKAYAGQFRPNPRWSLLTGRLEDSKAVQRAFDSYRGDKMAHEPLTLIRHAHSSQWVRISGFATPDELVAEYRRPIAQ